MIKKRRLAHLYLRRTLSCLSSNIKRQSFRVLLRSSNLQPSVKLEKVVALAGLAGPGWPRIALRFIAGYG